MSENEMVELVAGMGKNEELNLEGTSYKGVVRRWEDYIRSIFQK
jgi:hypothetical protein